jgi:uncharacterized protein with NAD-binding domain and iron-sulfur cluster
VLGGGVGGIVAAFQLTSTPELRERFEVTVHQLGWRIGGKGASGRNMERGGRIEEHGLHIWFGFYENAFRALREAYLELGREPGAPLATLEDAFKPCDQIVLYDNVEGEWHPFAFRPPRNFERPGVSGEVPTFWDVAARACEWALGHWRDLHRDHPDVATQPAPERFTPSWFADVAADFASELAETQLAGAEHLLHLATRMARENARSGAAPAGHEAMLVELLCRFRDWWWEWYMQDEGSRHARLRLGFTMIDIMASTLHGVVEDDILEKGFGAIDDEEWCDWLRRHGAKELTLGATPAERCPALRAVYDVAFGYVEGDIAKANVAAGTATSDLLRLCTDYRGSMMWKMQAGMGDTVFTPFYEVLRRRGVRFRFFSAVTDLGLSEDNRNVEEIEVVTQAELAGIDYQPLVEVAGLDCWPSEPLWEQLADGEALRQQGVDFEAESNPLGRPAETLKRGVDFDEVVLGISVAALPPICGNLAAANPEFAAMLDNAVTVQTQAFQLWLTEETAALGWAHDSNSVAGCYVEPMDTYCDMSHLLAREGWTEGDGPKSIAYFCGVIKERPGESPAETTKRARDDALEFLRRDVGPLWPEAITGKHPSPLRWDLLADPGAGKNELRFDSQFWRANTSLTERYVLSTAGSIQHRLASDESGFDNLVLAGDWTDNGVNGGCVEAAAISGLQAARALTGESFEIPGESKHWLRPAAKGPPANGSAQPNAAPQAPGGSAAKLVADAAGMTAELMGAVIGRVVRDVSSVVRIFGR